MAANVHINSRQAIYWGFVRRKVKTSKTHLKEIRIMNFANAASSKFKQKKGKS
jgi:hypothetical protein